MFAAEINVSEDDAVWLIDVDGLVVCVMANYAYSDVASVTGRLSTSKLRQVMSILSYPKYTVAHNYALSDNLLLVTEISYDDGDLMMTADQSMDDNSFSLSSLLFSF